MCCGPCQRPAYPTIDVSSALHMLRDGEVRFTDEELNALRESFYKHPRKWLSIEVGATGGGRTRPLWRLCLPRRTRASGGCMQDT